MVDAELKTSMRNSKIVTSRGLWSVQLSTEMSTWTHFLSPSVNPDFQMSGLLKWGKIMFIGSNKLSKLGEKQEHKGDAWVSSGCYNKIWAHRLGTGSNRVLFAHSSGDWATQGQGPLRVWFLERPPVQLSSHAGERTLVPWHPLLQDTNPMGLGAHSYNLI